MKKTDKIYVAGHSGLVGSALIRSLEKEGYTNLVVRTHKQLDLTIESAVAEFFRVEKPDYVFLAAAKVGGIHANNTYPAEFMRDNLAIQNNVIHHAYLNNVKRLLFLGSSCIYPKNAPQPLKEEYLLTGPLEETNRPYALAKIAGIEMCWSYNRQYGTQFLAAMPTNLYGIGDNYDLTTSHVLPAILRKIHLAKLVDEGNIQGVINDEVKFGRIAEPLRTEVFNCLDNKKHLNISIWGSGKPLREFMLNIDMADACVFLMNLSDEVLVPILGQDRNDSPPPVINIGTGEDLAIKDLVEMIKKVVGFRGETRYDLTKPDGTARKLMDVSKLHKLGWSGHHELEAGIIDTYKAYICS